LVFLVRACHLENGLMRTCAVLVPGVFVRGPAVL
jgi:hypothetical protein